MSGACVSFSNLSCLALSNIFHAYVDNSNMRRNLSAETVQIGVTEVFGQMRQTHFQSVTTNSSTFHNMRFDLQALLGKMSDASGDRISSLTSTKMFILCFKLARFIINIFFLRSRLEKQNANNETLRATVWKLRPVWKKKIIEATHLPLSGNSWAFDPPTPPEFPIPSLGGGLWIFSGTTHFGYL